MGALISQYLHQDPSPEWETWTEQVRRAKWAEKRFFENLARVMPRFE